MAATYVGCRGYADVGNARKHRIADDVLHAFNHPVSYEASTMDS